MSRISRMSTVCGQAPHRFVALTVVLVSSLTFAACKRSATQGAQVNPSNDPSAPVRTAVALAQPRELPDVLRASGSLLAEQQSELTTLVPGRVMQVLVERGAHVREGEPILRLRDVDFRTSQAQAQATLGQARARLGLENGAFNADNTAEVRAAAANRDMAEDGLRRATQLHTSGAMSDAEFQRASMQAEAARAQYRSTQNSMRGAYYGYQQAQAVAQQAGRALEDSTLRAPFAGEIAERRVNAGEYVTPQRSVVLLVRTDSMRMEIQIPQERLADVRRGQNVEVRVDAWPDRVFQGTVQYISAAVRPETRSLIVEAVIPNSDGVLRPGLFATARVSLGSRRQAVAVPSRAVLSEAGTSRVFVIAGGRAQERVVTVVERTADEVLIDRGLAAGERVATDNLTRLGDGIQVAEQ
jgi:RND family efflux transporter MFP subunit